VSDEQATVTLTLLGSRGSTVHLKSKRNPTFRYPVGLQGGIEFTTSRGKNMVGRVLRGGGSRRISKGSLQLQQILLNKKMGDVGQNSFVERTRGGAKPWGPGRSSTTNGNGSACWAVRWMGKKGGGQNRAATGTTANGCEREEPTAAVPSLEIKNELTMKKNNPKGQGDDG